MKSCATTIFFFLLHYANTAGAGPRLKDEETAAISYLKYLNGKSASRQKRLTTASWEYTSNLTEYNLQRKVAVATEVANEIKIDWLKTTKFQWKSLKNPDLRRQFKMFALLRLNALPSMKFAKYSKTVAYMQKVYATAKICDYHNSYKCDLALEPEITTIMSKSRVPDELKHAWLKWRDAIGPKIRHVYPTFVSLSNEAARLNNFTDMGELWLDDLESDNIREQLHNLWEQVKPLYLQMHAYVRYKLRQRYGDIVPERGPLPAHLLGDMWAQTWVNILDITLPYPEAAETDVTAEMIRQGYTPLKMFQKANDFFVSLNLTAMPESFWKKSILEKPKDGRDIVCHATAWYFQDNDVRIKMCTRVDEKNLMIIHHEMGHLEYYLQYSKQPTVYRKGANSAFHEAVGDTIFLSASSLDHLQKRLGLLKQTVVDDHTELNNLYKTGLEKIAFLPFSYLVDLWRWDIFSGKITEDNWNCKWWEFRHEYQGVEPPVNRTEDDFDAAGKYHIAADKPYIRYFISIIIQFQFHIALCLKAGEYIPSDPKKPLHNCNIYHSKVAGNALGDMLQMGASKPWPEVMEVLTGQRDMDASGLLEYFKPLQSWLEKENKKNGVSIGWEPTQKACLRAKKKNNVAKKTKNVAKGKTETSSDN